MMTAEAMPAPALIDSLDEAAFARGWRLLQPHRFGDTNDDHIRVLLDLARFPLNSRVLDIGCGYGECARLMRMQRPDLEFVLVNFSTAQLARCPEGMERHEANAHALPFADKSFDAVMFNAALGNMDAMVAIAESARVLKPGGVLFLNELRRIDGDNALIESMLRFRAYPENGLMAFAKDIGLNDCETHAPTVVHEYLREQWDCPDATYDDVFSGIEAGVWRFVKGKQTLIAARLGAIFARHERVALQISGGKDSLVILHALRPWWDRLCVYWLNPGNPFQETIEFMSEVRATVPHFKEVRGRQPEIIARDGWPSDVVPQRYTTDGNAVFGATPFKVQPRLACCIRSLMLPLHAAIKADGVTCVIRGKRSEEADRTGLQSGYVSPEGIELVFPIYDWTAADVFSYLDTHGIQLPPSYTYATHSLDCMDCTAWWGEGLSRFLAAKYPEQHAQYIDRIRKIKAAIAEQMNDCEV